MCTRQSSLTLLIRPPSHVFPCSTSQHFPHYPKLITRSSHPIQRLPTLPVFLCPLINTSNYYSVLPEPLSLTSPTSFTHWEGQQLTAPTWFPIRTVWAPFSSHSSIASPSYQPVVTAHQCAYFRPIRLILQLKPGQDAFVLPPCEASRWDGAE